MDPGLIRDPLLLSALEAASRTRTQCLTILDFLDTHALKSTSTSEPEDSTSYALARHQKQLISRLAYFRGLFRNAALSARATKQETSEAKSEIDTLHLQLQNLLYEQRHLKGEIAACEDYNHSHKSLSLLPVHEAQTLNPSLSSHKTDHDLMLARIQDEHQRRQDLEAQRNELVKQRQALIAANKSKKDELDVLDREIEKFVAASGPVKEIFEKRRKAIEQREREDKERREKEEARNQKRVEGTRVEKEEDKMEDLEAATDMTATKADAAVDSVNDPDSKMAD